MIGGNLPSGVAFPAEVKVEVEAVVRMSICCPKGHENQVELPRRLELRAATDVRQPLLDGSFGQFSCPACQTRFALDQELVYRDWARGHAVHCVRRAGLAQWWQLEAQLPDRIGVPGDGMVSMQRLVFGQEQLREKLLLWETGLDDRLIELAKLETIHRDDLGLRDTGKLDLVLDRVDLSRGRLYFTAREVFPPQRPQNVYISFDRYDSLADAQLELRQAYPDLFVAPFVSLLRYCLPPPA